MSCSDCYQRQLVLNRALWDQYDAESVAAHYEYHRNLVFKWVKEMNFGRGKLPEFEELRKRYPELPVPREPEEPKVKRYTK